MCTHLQTPKICGYGCLRMQALTGRPVPLTIITVRNSVITERLGDSYGTTNKILLARALENSAAKALTGEIKFYNPANTSRPKTFMFDPKTPQRGRTSVVSDMGSMLPTTTR